MNRALIHSLGLMAFLCSAASHSQGYALDAPERAHIRQTIEVG